MQMTYLSSPSQPDRLPDPPASESGSRAPAPGGLSSIPEVYRYEDYRVFLCDRFSAMQVRDPSFSQRGLARRAGIANPGFFNEVIKGRRRLSPAAARKLSVGLALTEEETEYFSLLVEFTEARAPRAKVAAGKRLMQLQSRRMSQLLGQEPEPLAVFQDIVGELKRDWILQAAGLEFPGAREDGSASDLVPMSEGGLGPVLEKLTEIRREAEGSRPPREADAASRQEVRFMLQLRPRAARPDMPPS